MSIGAARRLLRARRPRDQPDRHPGRAELRRRRDRRPAGRRRRGGRRQRRDGGRGAHRAALAAGRRRGPGAARLRQHARPRAGRLLRAPSTRSRPPSAPHVVATEIPIGAEHEVRGVVDLIDHEGVRLRGRRAGRRRRRSRSPRSCARQAEEYREKLMDEVAENSDELMERYLEGEEIDHDEIVTRAEAGRHRGAASSRSPAASATRNLGTDRLLEALVEDLPSPAMRGRGARRSAPAGRRSRSSPTRTGRWSPTSSRPSPTPTRAASTSSASTAARCAPTRRSSTSPAARRSGSASSASRSARS